MGVQGRLLPQNPIQLQEEALGAVLKGPIGSAGGRGLPVSPALWPVLPSAEWVSVPQGWGLAELLPLHGIARGGSRGGHGSRHGQPCRACQATAVLELLRLVFQFH